MNREYCHAAILCRIQAAKNSLSDSLAERVEWQPPITAYETAIGEIGILFDSIQKPLREAEYTTPENYFGVAKEIAREARNKILARKWKNDLEREIIGMAGDEIDKIAFGLSSLAISERNRARWMEGGERFLSTLLTRSSTGFFFVQPTVTISINDEVICLLKKMEEGAILAKRLNDVRSYLGTPMDAIAGHVILTKLIDVEKRIESQNG